MMTQEPARPSAKKMLLGFVLGPQVMVLAALLFVIAQRIWNFPRGTFFIYTVVVAIAYCVFRFGYRKLMSRELQLKSSEENGYLKRAAAAERLLRRFWAGIIVIGLLVTFFVLRNPPRSMAGWLATLGPNLIFLAAAVWATVLARRKIRETAGEDRSQD